MFGKKKKLVDELMYKNSVLKERLDHRETHISKLKIDNEKNLVQIDEYKSRIDTLEEIIVNKRTEISELEEKNKSYEETIQKLSDDLVKYKELYSNITHSYLDKIESYEKIIDNFHNIDISINRIDKILETQFKELIDNINIINNKISNVNHDDTTNQSSNKIFFDNIDSTDKKDEIDNLPDELLMKIIHKFSSYEHVLSIIRDKNHEIAEYKKIIDDSLSEK